MIDGDGSCNVPRSVSQMSDITRVSAWWLAIRPRTLPAAVAPIIVGSALALDADRFHLPSMIAALAVALLLQIGANLANDGFDHAHGADVAGRLGPLRVTQQGLLSFRQVMIGTAIATTMAMAAGSYLVYRGGWSVLVMGVASIIVMLAYTGGPMPLGYHGLGEVSVFIFFGLLGVAGSFYVQARELPLDVVMFSIPVGALIAAILVVNNLRDIETDARAGKRTLAVRFGSRASVIEYAALLIGSYFALPLIWLTSGGVWWWLLPWLSLPLAVRLVRAIGSESGSMLNRRLAQTAQLALVFSLLLGAGVLL
jgi:1,4-dihydroxy-2-naphthoate polyprenyltransferase